MAQTTIVVLVGIGGATCSGKTTLAKNLRQILPGSVIVHQDDFAPPQELIPVHPIYKVQDWDAAPGAISWDRFIRFLDHVKKTGIVPDEHKSHDHLNEQKPVNVDDDVKDRWKRTFSLLPERTNKKIIWVLVDGFLLYWSQRVIDQLDVHIFLRVPHDVLKQRRDERSGYFTAGERSDMLAIYGSPSLLLSSTHSPLIPQPHSTSILTTQPSDGCPYGVQSDPEGTFWRDPPNYWEQIVYPAYIDAHKGVFEGGDVEHGRPTGKVRDMVLLDSLDMSMNDIIETCCRKLLSVVEQL